MHMQIWDIHNRSIICGFERQADQQLECWSPDSRFICASSTATDVLGDVVLRIYDASSGSCLTTIGWQPCPWKVSWAPDGSYLAVCSHKQVRAPSRSFLLR